MSVAKPATNICEMGYRILEELKHQGKTQADLSRYVEVSSQAVNRWITGRGEITKKNLVKVCAFLDVQEEWILFGRMATVEDKVPMQTMQSYMQLPQGDREIIDELIRTLIRKRNNAI
jgi:transcriptional regulator with XRE-family HTH domain